MIKVITGRNALGERAGTGQCNEDMIYFVMCKVRTKDLCGTKGLMSCNENLKMEM